MKHRLELNTSGSWKLIMRFDGDDRDLAERLRDAAEDLAELAIEAERRSVMSWRISTDEPQPRALEYWRSEGGMWLPA